MISTHIILGSVWIVYCVLHSVLASETIRHRIMHVLRITKVFYRRAYNVLAAVTLIIILAYQLRISTAPVLLPGVVSYVLSAVFILPGALIMAICIKKYFMQLSGVNRSAMKPQLEVTGLHQLVRHPLYLGTFLFIIGLFFLFPVWSGLIAVVIIITYTLIGIRFEERKLVQQFGESYREYQQKTPMIIPAFGRK